MPTASAAVQTGDRTIEMQQLDIPTTLAPGEALLRVEGSGMCGSDVEQYHGVAAAKGLMTYPGIPGHEIVGRIDRITDEASQRWRVDVGTRVAVVGGPRCGTCQFCRLEHTGWRPCTSGVTYGFHPTSVGSGLWGGYAEVLHLLPGTTLIPLPDELDVRDAVLFNPLSAGFDWVIRAGGMRPGDTVLITGAGQRGLASVVAARQGGASQIIVTGLSHDAEKLELARRLGATTTVDVERDQITDVIGSVTNGRGADLVVEATPHATAPVVDALAAARFAGTVVLAGLKGGRTADDFPVDTIVHKVLKVVGVLGTSTWSSEQAIRTIVAGDQDFSFLHSHTFGLDGVEHAMQLLAGEVAGETPIHITITPG